MEHPLVIAYHLIWTAYGWWLPNDPRGSGSRTIRNEVFAELGGVHFGRKRVQPLGRVVREFYEKAADLLKHPLLTFDEFERRLIGEAFAEVVEAQRYTCYACAIMPDHVHMVIRKHKDCAEQMVENLKETSRARLIEAGRRAVTHPTWLAGPGWNVFLGHPDDVRRTIRCGAESDQDCFAGTEVAVRESVRWLALASGAQPAFALRAAAAETGEIPLVRRWRRGARGRK